MYPSKPLGLPVPRISRGKVLVDVSNPLDYSKGMPPSLKALKDDSVGEMIQRTFPDTKVVKSLNTVRAAIKVDPKLLPGEHDVFLSGNDPEAKAQVRRILEEFGWTNIIDLGDISTARATEMWMALWLRLMVKSQSPLFNLHIVRIPAAPEPTTASR